MKGTSNWSFSPYKPFLFDSGDIYITRVCPYDSYIHLEWQNPEGERCEIYYRKRDCGEFKKHGTTVGEEFDIYGLTDDYEYEFYVKSGNKKNSC